MSIDLNSLISEGQVSFSVDWDSEPTTELLELKIVEGVYLTLREPKENNLQSPISGDRTSTEERVNDEKSETVSVTNNTTINIFITKNVDSKEIVHEVLKQFESGKREYNF